jgi:hypothetical protein
MANPPKNCLRRDDEAKAIPEEHTSFDLFQAPLQPIAQLAATTSLNLPDKF